MSEIGEKKTKKESISIAFISSVDVGKSTISGHLLLLTGNVDKRELENCKEEAKQYKHATDGLAEIMDMDQEEKSRGITVNHCAAFFETSRKRVTILDCPGHKVLVSNMIDGASRADVAALVVSARKDEFESSFERGGQVKEHTILAKALGIEKLVVLVNKMDEKTVLWSKSRFEEIKTKLTPFLKGCGYAEKDVCFIPVSGLLGLNLITRVCVKDKVSWPHTTVLPSSSSSSSSSSSVVSGIGDVRDGTHPSFLEYIDELKIARYPDYPLRIVVYGQKSDTFSGGGGSSTLGWITGKIEYGTLTKGQQLILMPEKKLVTCTVIQVESQTSSSGIVEVDNCVSGDNVILKLTGAEKVEKGSILCAATSKLGESKSKVGEKNEIVPVCREFLASIRIVSLPAGKKVLMAGYEAVLHAYSTTVNCRIVSLAGSAKFLREGDSCECKIETTTPVCLERADKSLNDGRDFSKLSRFILRDENSTVAIGKVNRLKEIR